MSKGLNGIGRLTTRSPELLIATLGAVVDIQSERLNEVAVQLIPWVIDSAPEWADGVNLEDLWRLAPELAAVASTQMRQASWESWNQHTGWPQYLRDEHGEVVSVAIEEPTSGSPIAAQWLELPLARVDEIAATLQPDQLEWLMPDRYMIAAFEFLKVKQSSESDLLKFCEENLEMSLTAATDFEGLRVAVERLRPRAGYHPLSILPIILLVASFGLHQSKNKISQSVEVLQAGLQLVPLLTLRAIIHGAAIRTIQIQKEGQSA